MPSRSAAPTSGPVLAALLALAFLFLAGCDRPAPAASTPHPLEARIVLTSFYPLTYFAERIAGPHLTIRCPCPPTVDPSFWIPSRADLLQFQSASLILLNGAGYEHWTAGAALPVSRTVETAQPFAAEFLQLPTQTHAHGPGGSHTHSGLDGHTWLDPLNARQQAREILTAFTAHWPEHAPDFQQGFVALTHDFDLLDQRLRALSPALTGHTLFASHPAYGYLARRYGWPITNVNLPPDEAPAEETWQPLRRALEQASDGPRLLFFESEPLAPIRHRLATELHTTAVVFRPCETTPAGENYLTLMLQNIDTLKRALSPSQP